MRHKFGRGRRTVAVCVIIAISVFAVIETLLGNVYGTISSYSLPEISTLQTMAQIHRTSELQKIYGNLNMSIATKSARIIIRTPTKRRQTMIPTKVSSVTESTIGSRLMYTREITKNCTPRVDASKIKTPFKFYIYDLPSKFNYDIQRLFSDEREYSFCYNLDYCGMGEELYQYTAQGTKLSPQGEQLSHQGEQLSHQGTQLSPPGEELFVSLSVRNTHQFSLEVLIHYKLLHSPYRTSDPQKADMFYIPAYTGLNCLTFKDNSEEFVNELFQYLETNEVTYFKSGKPHFSTLSKIQREQGSQTCPTLRHPDTRTITYIAIEKESNPNWSKNEEIYGNSIIVAPYPSYIHFINPDRNNTSFEYDSGHRNLNESKLILAVPSLPSRNVLLFLAAGMRRSNTFRARVLDQFAVKTDKCPDDFYKGTSNSSDIRQVMLITSECAVQHRSTTIPWMRHSVFCLQPPGDSPTRKSIYDSILSGCIPVLFTASYKTEYPFKRHLDYDSFTYTINEILISRYNKTVLEIIKGISEERTRSMHENLLRVAKWFQYSIADGDVQWQDDAMTLILDQLAFHNGIANERIKPKHLLPEQ